MPIVCWDTSHLVFQLVFKSIGGVHVQDIGLDKIVGDVHIGAAVAVEIGNGYAQSIREIPNPQFFRDIDKLTTLVFIETVGMEPFLGSSRGE